MTAETSEEQTGDGLVSDDQGAPGEDGQTDESGTDSSAETNPQKQVMPLRQKRAIRISIVCVPKWKRRRIYRGRRRYPCYNQQENVWRC